MIQSVVATSLLVLGMMQDSYERRVEKIVTKLDPLPFESFSKNQADLDRFKKAFPAFSPESPYSDGHSSVYQLVAHPRHTAAYQNLSGFVEWRKAPPKATVVVNEAKFAAAKVDADGSTYLNRLMLSHLFLTEQDALLVFQELATRKQLDLKPNKFGQTPLMLAAEAGWQQITDQLLRLRASRTAKDIEGHDVIDYLKFARPEVKIGEVAQREVFTVELVADVLYKGSNATDKKRIFKVMNDWLSNPYRFTCGNYPEGMFNLKWPTPRGKKKKETPAQYIIDKPNRPFDLRNPPPK